MIIWINGSFGVGKTTTAEKLKEKLKNAIIYDPEKIGTFLYETLPNKEDDFQDYKLWRKINYVMLKYLNDSFENVIVPMTITSLQYYNEVVGNLKNENIEVKEFVLIASKENLTKRLDKRGNSTNWAYEQIDRCIDSFDSNFYGIKIDTNNADEEEVVCEILEVLN